MTHELSDSDKANDAGLRSALKRWVSGDDLLVIFLLHDHVAFLQAGYSFWSIERYVQMYLFKKLRLREAYIHVTHEYCAIRTKLRLPHKCNAKAAELV